MSLENKIDQTDLTFFTNEDGHSLLSRFYLVVLSVCGKFMPKTICYDD